MRTKMVVASILCLCLSHSSLAQKKNGLVVEAMKALGRFAVDVLGNIAADEIEKGFEPRRKPAPVQASPFPTAGTGAVRLYRDVARPSEWQNVSRATEDAGAVRNVSRWMVRWSRRRSVHDCSILAKKRSGVLSHGQSSAARRLLAASNLVHHR